MFRRAVSIGALLVVALALSAIAVSSAVALPDVSVTLSSKYPIHVSGTLSGATSVGEASGVLVEGKGETLLANINELTALGEFTSVLTNIVAGHEKCHSVVGSESDATGVLLETGTYHVVLTPVGLALLYLLKEFEIICGKEEALAKGSLISSLTKAGTESTELATIGGVLQGTKGKQSLTEYINDGGTITKTSFLLNVGSGFVLADTNVEGELVAEAGGEMVVITNR